MALAVDATSTKNTGAVNASPVTWTHTISSNTNGAVFVCFGWNGTATISAVTYNGSNMTQVGTTSTQGSGSTTLSAAIYVLVAQPTGAKTVSVSFSTTVSFWGWAISFTGVDQSTPAEANNKSSGTSAASPITTSVTTTTDSDYVIDMAAYGASGTVTVGGSQTQVLNLNNSATATRGVGSYLTSVKSPAGSVSMQWTYSGNQNWAQIVAAVKPAGSSTPNAGQFFSMF